MTVVFVHELRLLLRDRWAVVWLIVLPVLFISLIVAARYSGEAEPRLFLPVVNEDQGPVADALVKLLGDRADVKEMSREHAERLVRDENRVAAAIVLPSGLSKRYLSGRRSEIVLLTDPAEAVGVRRVQVLLLLIDREASTLADPIGP